MFSLNIFNSIILEKYSVNMADTALSNIMPLFYWFLYTFILCDDFMETNES